MALQNQLSDFTELISGTYGTIYYVDLSTQRMKEVKLIILVHSTEMQSITNQTDQNVMLDQPENVNCPDVAFCQEGKILYIFAKDSVFPDDAYCGFVITRNSIPVDNTSDKADIPDFAGYLFQALAEKRLKEEDSERLGFNIEQGIIKEKSDLGLS